MSEKIESYNTVCQKAIIKYGVEAQTDMLIEEMAELTTALLHKRRGREDNVPEEFADVVFLMDQLKPIFNEENRVDNWLKFKKEKLEKKVG